MVREAAGCSQTVPEGREGERGGGREEEGGTEGGGGRGEGRKRGERVEEGRKKEGGRAMVRESFQQQLSTLCFTSVMMYSTGSLILSALSANVIRVCALCVCVCVCV